MSDIQLPTLPSPLSALPPKQKLARLLFIGAATALFALQFWWLRHSITSGRKLEYAPVEYSKLQSDRGEYAPGDTVHFSYNRWSVIIDDRPILLLTVDSFENQDTGEIFQGTFASRIVRNRGIAHLHASRKIPIECTPGTYIFEGWASSQTNPPSAAVPYSSNPFTVK